MDNKDYEILDDTYSSTNNVTTTNNNNNVNPINNFNNNLINSNNNIVNTPVNNNTNAFNSNITDSSFNSLNNLKEVESSTSVVNNTPLTNTRTKNEINDNKKNKVKKKSKLIYIIILIVVVLASSSFLFYTFILMNKNLIVKNSVDKFFDVISNNYKSMTDNYSFIDFNKGMGLDGKLKISSDYKNEYIDLTNLGNYTFNYGGILDIKENKASFNLSLDKNNKELASLLGYINGKTLKLQSNNLFNNILKTDINKEIKERDFNDIFNYDNIDEIIIRTKEMTKNYIKDDDITKEYIEKTINNKKDTYVHIKYKLDLNDYHNYLVQEYLNDEKMIDILAKIYNKDREIIKSSLETILKYKEETPYVVNIDIYLDKISSSLKELDITKDNNKFVITSNNDIFNYYFLVDENKVLTGEYNKRSKELKADITSDNNVISLYIRKDNNNYNIILKILNNNNVIEINTTYENKIKDDILNINLDTNILTNFNDVKNTFSISNSL